MRGHKKAQKVHVILQSHLCFLCLFAAFQAVAQKRIDYSRFSHVTEKHKLECQTCHKFPSPNWKVVRKESNAFPDISEFPDHQSCIGCHRTQFFARERPAPKICSNCHVNASPRDTSRWPFPSLGEPFLTSARGKGFVSDFKVLFPKDKHEVEEGSPVEMKHSNCFTCHNQESELAPLPQSCGSCHKPATVSTS